MTTINHNTGFLTEPKRIMTTKKQKVDWRIVSVGLVCLTALEAVALMNGINGTLLKLVLVVIAGAIGVTIPNPFKTK